MVGDETGRMEQDLFPLYSIFYIKFTRQTQMSWEKTVLRKWGRKRGEKYDLRVREGKTRHDRFIYSFCSMHWKCAVQQCFFTSA